MWHYYQRFALGLLFLLCFHLCTMWSWWTQICIFFSGCFTRDLELMYPSTLHDVPNQLNYIEGHDWSEYFGDCFPIFLTVSCAISVVGSGHWLYQCYFSPYWIFFYNQFSPYWCYYGWITTFSFPFIFFLIFYIVKILWFEMRFMIQFYSTRWTSIIFRTMNESWEKLNQWQNLASF